jgi:hypothetical protein
MASVPEYKVIQGSTQAVEKELNSLAAQGWHVITTAGLSGAYEIAVILERRK